MALAVHHLHDLDEDDVCNDSDKLAERIGDGSKLVWHFRHGQSTGNVARDQAHSRKKLEAYRRNPLYADAPLTELGKQQACDAAQVVATWKVQPDLVICSSLTRSIQTAALIFAQQLSEGVQLIVRPELREYWPDNIENQGRPLPDLRRCKHLHGLPSWPAVEKALSAEQTADWSEEWDANWANGDKWTQHCGSGERMKLKNEEISWRTNAVI